MQLGGRAFPGIHIQGDTFAELSAQLARATATLRHDRGNIEATESLAAAVEEMSAMLAFYESALSEHRIRRPY